MHRVFRLVDRTLGQRRGCRRRIGDISDKAPTYTRARTWNAGAASTVIGSVCALAGTLSQAAPGWSAAPDARPKAYTCIKDRDEDSKEKARNLTCTIRYLACCLTGALLFGFTAGEPRVSAYRWCVHSVYAINCGFQTQAACTAAASRTGGWCDLTVVREPYTKRR